ncbi:MAG: phage virion morphogenesis protein [Geobacteraceae bacterium]|nr:phage virion morphogenesis protein [Geobacteraceae bacterium]
MAGAFTPYVTIDDKDLMRKLKTLDKRASGLTPVLKNIGEYKVEATQELFTKEQDPQGVKWAALSKRYKEKKKGTKILTETRRLRDSIIYAVRNGNLKIGTNVVYGAAHQFGIDKNLTVPAHRRLVKKVYKHVLKFPVWATVRAHTFNPHLPARPYLGWNQTDRTEIRGIVQDFLEMD